MNLTPRCTLRGEIVHAPAGAGIPVRDVAKNAFPPRVVGLLSVV